MCWLGRPHNVLHSVRYVCDLCKCCVWWRHILLCMWHELVCVVCDCVHVHGACVVVIFGLWRTDAVIPFNVVVKRLSLDAWWRWRYLISFGHTVSCSVLCDIQSWCNWAWYVVCGCVVYSVYLMCVCVACMFVNCAGDKFGADTVVIAHVSTCKCVDDCVHTAFCRQHM